LVDVDTGGIGSDSGQDPVDVSAPLTNSLGELEHLVGLQDAVEVW
jgi:hypothetical protein